VKKLLTIFLLVATLVGVVFGGELPGDAQPSISKFRERFSLRFLCDYNFMMIKNSAVGDEPLVSNRPVDVGIGFGYDSLFTLFGASWDISWDFKYGLPFTTSNGHSESKSFETGLDLFPGDWWLSAKLRYYSGFTQNLEDSDEDVFIDLTVMDIYFSMLWMATARGKFAPRSAYFLDRRQKSSAGSLIIGGRLQYNGAEDNDGVLQYEDDKYQLLTIWGDVGYTYSWIFRSGYFCNLWGVVGIAYGREKAEDDNILLPEFDGKFAFGYIGEKWSWNIVLKADYSIMLYDEYKEEKFVAAFEILVVRRF
jgi:hypothetical protein